TLLQYLFLSMMLATTETYPLSLHDALPICWRFGKCPKGMSAAVTGEVVILLVNVLVVIHTCYGLKICAAILPIPVKAVNESGIRSEEHTSELQSRENIVCRLLLEKKKKTNK